MINPDYRFVKFPYPSGFSSSPLSPPLPPPLFPPPETPSSDTSSKIKVLGLPLVVALVSFSKRVRYFEADIHPFDVFHRTIFGGLGGATLEGGIEDTEPVQADVIPVRQRLPYLADEGSAYMYHVFGGHAAQCLDVLRDAFEVENLGVFWLASQRVDHRRGIVAYFLVSLRTHY